MNLSKLSRQGTDKIFRIRMSAASGIAGGILMTLGDLLMTGGAAPSSMLTSSLLQGGELSSFLAASSSARLLSGALVASFALPFLLLSLYHLYLLIKPAGERYSILVAALLFFGFCFVPIEQFSLYYIGEACKVASSLGSEGNLELINRFESVQNVAFLIMAITAGAGYVLLSVAILRKKTGFPAGFAFLTPPFLAVLLLLVKKVLSGILQAPLTGAIFGVSIIGFYAASFLFCSYRARQKPPFIFL